ncbi:MAG: ribosome recycling factor [Planctomycetota bacterium]
MDIDEILLTAEERMGKSLEVMGNGFRAVRTGRANPEMIDGLYILYHGARTPLKTIASVTTPEPRLLCIRPWEKEILKEIEKAIIKEDLGFNPMNDGSMIRIQIPPLSEEQRRKLVHRVKEIAEETRIAIRNIRKDANKDLDKEKKDSTIREDDWKKAKEDIQELTESYNKKIEDIVEKKSKDLMEI